MNKLYLAIKINKATTYIHPSLICLFSNSIANSNKKLIFLRNLLKKEPSKNVEYIFYDDLHSSGITPKDLQLSAVIKNSKKYFVRYTNCSICEFSEDCLGIPKEYELNCDLYG